MGKCAAAVLPKEPWVVVSLGRSHSHLAAGHSGSTVLACVVAAPPSQHLMKLGPAGAGCMTGLSVLS